MSSSESPVRSTGVWSYALGRDGPASDDDVEEAARSDDEAWFTWPIGSVDDIVPGAQSGR